MLPVAPIPLAPAVVLALVREHPPHQAFEPFLDAVAARRRTEPASWMETVGRHALSTPTVGRLACAEVQVCRGLYGTSARHLGEIADSFRAAWPRPNAQQGRLLDLLIALREVAVLLEAGAISSAAALRLSFVLDPGRPRELPTTGEDLFGGAPTGPVGLRDARSRLATDAPMFWQLASAELERLLDQLDPS